MAPRRARLLGVRPVSILLATWANFFRRLLRPGVVLGAALVPVLFSRSTSTAAAQLAAVSLSAFWLALVFLLEAANTAPPFTRLELRSAAVPLWPTCGFLFLPPSTVLVLFCVPTPTRSAACRLRPTGRALGAAGAAGCTWLSRWRFVPRPGDSCSGRLARTGDATTGSGLPSRTLCSRASKAPVSSGEDRACRAAEATLRAGLKRPPPARE